MTTQAAVNELIVEMTNVFRRSKAFNKSLCGSETAEVSFDAWQEVLLVATRICINNWDAENDLAEKSLDVFKRSLETFLTPDPKFKEMS